MRQEIQALFRIIKYYLNDKKIELTLDDFDFKWEDLISVATYHKVLNFVYYAVEEFGLKDQLSEETYRNLFQSAMYEMTKSYNQMYAVEELLSTFEKEGIYGLVVKGSCTKKYYPQQDMRTMGDIDVLYRDSQQQKVRRVMKQMDYKRRSEGRKHDCYIRDPFIVVEMHRELVATDSKYSSYYKEVWSRLSHKDNHIYICEMSLEDEYIYMLVHLVEHFINGGIGIRFVMDVYIYNHLKEMDWVYIQQELKKLQIWDFYNNISVLAELWFGIDMINFKEDERMLEELSSYIIANGVFGTHRNSAALSVTKNGRIGFLFSALFPDLKNMQSMFPWLKRWPILLPYSWCLRGVRSVLYRPKHIKSQMDKCKYGNKEYGQKLREFFVKCGL